MQSCFENLISKMKNFALNSLILFFIVNLSFAQSELKCFVPGACEDSVQVGLTITQDEFDCLDLCQEDPTCKWFTFDGLRGEKFCETFDGCNRLDVEGM